MVQLFVVNMADTGKQTWRMKGGRFGSKKAIVRYQKLEERHNREKIASDGVNDIIDHFCGEVIRELNESTPSDSRSV